MNVTICCLAAEFIMVRDGARRKSRKKESAIDGGVVEFQRGSEKFCEACIRLEDLAD